MTDHFADGWMEFQIFIDRLRKEHNLSIKDIKEYVEMYEDDNK